MGTGTIYSCGCRAPKPLMTGAGKLTPRICTATWEDMKTGKYGENWKRAVTMHPNGGLDCDYVIHVCDCGHWEQNTKKTLWEKGNKSHCKSRLPRNRCVKRYYHLCPTCGKRMRIANLEKDCLKCPDCHQAMTDFKPYIKWD